MKHPSFAEYKAMQQKNPCAGDEPAPMSGFVVGPLVLRSDMDLDAVTRAVLEAKQTPEWWEHVPVMYRGSRCELPILGEGASRTVVGLPSDDWVLKIGESMSAWEQNKREVDLFHRSHGEQRDRLAKPVYWADDFSWVIFERVACDWERVHREFDEMMDLERLYRGVVWDLHEGNYGFRPDGTLIVVDYGHQIGGPL